MKISGGICKLYNMALTQKVAINYGIVYEDNGRILVITTPPDAPVDIAVILEPNDNAKQIK